MERSSKPWHAMPSRIISLALVHAEQDTDFDHHLAFLLLDVGVETTLKAYLIGKKQDVEKIVFPELLKRVGDEISKDRLQVPLDEIDYFHKIRNKLYHQGDGVRPTEENLRKYTEHAKVLLKILLDVDMDKPQENETIKADYDLLERIQKNVMSLQSNSSILVEFLYPQITTRKFAAQVKYIKTEYPDVDFGEIYYLEKERELSRIEKFNTLTGWELSGDAYDFVDYIINNPERLHIWIAFQELSDDWRKDWEKYKAVINCLNYQKFDIKAEYKSYEEIYEWTKEKAGIICDWIHIHIPNVEIEGPDLQI